MSRRSVCGNPERGISGPRQGVIWGGGLGVSGAAFAGVPIARFLGNSRRKCGPKIDHPRRPAGAQVSEHFRLRVARFRPETPHVGGCSKPPKNGRLPRNDRSGRRGEAGNYGRFEETPHFSGCSKPPKKNRNHRKSLGGLGTWTPPDPNEEPPKCRVLQRRTLH